MSETPDENDWPRNAALRSSLPVEIDPPASLEDRTVGLLRRRGLLETARARAAVTNGWRGVRASFAIAACVAVLALGVVLGRMSVYTESPVPGTLTGAETDLYALLLFETRGYDRPSGAEALARYSEYSEWIAIARERDQFVTGEDLDVGEGWLLAPSASGVDVQQRLVTDQSAPLSGVLFIRAEDSGKALQLAKALPHIRHGGEVVVQKTRRTDLPPPVTQ